jgi:hypothetical protein
LSRVGHLAHVCLDKLTQRMYISDAENILNARTGCTVSNSDRDEDRQR